MDIGSAFTYMFDDEEWIKKLAIGGAVALVGAILTPILIGIALLLPLSGYMIDVLRNVRDGQPRPLPEWSDWGGLFRTGLFVFVIGLVYNIPVIILACGSGIVQSVAPQMDPDTADALMIAGACLSCLQIVVSLICNLFVPAAIIRYAQFNTVSSAFQFGEIFSFIRNNIGDYIIVVLLSWVASVIAGFGVILCVVGVFFTFFWSYLVSANLYGQLARKSPVTM
ncbi:MAG: DUF4013 domain-containing protein [Anaerolineae bacterium]|nr:DUF4013 domain-containing protein [Anaerolineae bacterium]